MKAIPLMGRVILQKIEEDEKESKIGSLLILPDSAKPKRERYRVVSISNEKPIVQVGDVVGFGKYAGQLINLDDGEYLIVEEKDILWVECEDE